MIGSLLRALLWTVLIVFVVVGLGLYFLGHRTIGGPTSSAAVATSGHRAEQTAREAGAEIGERVGAVADRAGELLSDGAITAKIKSKMALDDHLKANRIGVTTRDGAVTVSGTVGSTAERERALQLARETDGVKSVTDRLQIAK